MGVPWSLLVPVRYPSGIFWVDGGSKETLERSFLLLGAKCLGLGTIQHLGVGANKVWGMKRGV